MYTGKLNLGLIKDEARRDLVHCLKQFDGSKVIIWDKVLMSSFGLIADFPFLKQYDVTRVIKLESGRLPGIQRQACDILCSGRTVTDDHHC
ncbi:Vacuolar protein sorting-associated protein 33A [Halotydeus destructor]|nr:Vacuolar protein sorting-associated protein 33A [Halotydeus destructor]